MNAEILLYFFLGLAASAAVLYPILLKSNGKVNSLRSIEYDLKNRAQILSEKIAALNKELSHALIEKNDFKRNNKTLIEHEQNLTDDKNKLLISIKDLEEHIKICNAEKNELYEKIIATEVEALDKESKLKILLSELGDEKAKYSNLAALYLPFSSNFDDALKIVLEIKTLEEEKLSIHDEINSLSKKYSEGYNDYNDLLAELNLIKERLDIYSFGLYEPHFDFETSDEYKNKLDSCYKERKELVKSDLAAICNTKWTVNGSTAEGTKQTKAYKKIMIRAFNGECDAAIANTRWNNIVLMEKRIEKSFELINKLGETNHTALTDDFFDIRIKELRLAHEYQDKLHEEKEEQRRIRKQIKDEEFSIKEIEQARAAAEQEEIYYLKALDKVRSELLIKSGTEREMLKDKICSLEDSLRKAIDLKERAISMAQITKAGHVYIISNLGSFGDNVFKIGMTRRLEPSRRPPVFE